jgi:hypothetical protein
MGLWKLHLFILHALRTLDVVFLLVVSLHDLYEDLEKLIPDKDKGHPHKFSKWATVDVRL